jgi:hypothetical protein
LICDFRYPFIISTNFYGVTSMKVTFSVGIRSIFNTWSYLETKSLRKGLLLTLIGFLIFINYNIRPNIDYFPFTRWQNFKNKLNLLTSVYFLILSFIEFFIYINWEQICMFSFDIINYSYFLLVKNLSFHTVHCSLLFYLTCILSFCFTILSWQISYINM